MATAKKRSSGATTRDAPPGASAALPRRLSGRWWAALTGIILWGLITQTLLLTEAWRENPLASVPIVDAEAYWNWAGDIASGRLLSSEPFMSAPLYPYLLGAVRALGGGLLTVYVLQVALHLATVGLLAYAAAKRFGAATGLLTGALFVLLTEPAFVAGRVLNCTVQLLSVVVLWLALLRAQQRSSLGTWALVGALIGLNCLLNPPMLLAIGLVGLWAWWQCGGGRRGAGSAAMLVGTAVLVISPATIHNYKVSGELIPISAQAGLTFAHGNARGADGTYTPIAGVSTDRKTQNLDALRLYQQTTGNPGSWNAVNRFFFQKGLEHWRSNPGEALVLLVRKLYWFVSGRNAGDIYFPALEAKQGLADRLRLAPLPLAWLTLPALVALVALARSPRRYGPELILVAVPLLVVVAFFFSPRYRLPALPVLVIACAWALRQLAQWRTRRSWSISVALALVIGLGLGPLNRALGFDRLDGYRAHFHHALGEAASRAGRLAEAAVHYRTALELKPDFTQAAANLGNALTRLGRPGEAVAHLRAAVRADPRSAIFNDQLGRALVAQDRPDEALPYFQAAVRLRPDRADLRNNLANTLVRTGDDEGALKHYRAALRINPGHANAHLNLGNLLRHQGDTDGALGHFRAALRCNPMLTAAHVQLAKILLARGNTRSGIAALRRAHELAPGSSAIANDLAWYLATTPNLPPADRATALRLARAAAAARDSQSLEVLDTLAAALAANGMFTEAATVVAQAIVQAEKLGATERAAQFRPLLELYRSGKPYSAPLDPASP